MGTTSGFKFKTIMRPVGLATPYTDRGIDALYSLEKRLKIDGLQEKYKADFMPHIYVPPFEHRNLEEEGAEDDETKYDSDFDPERVWINTEIAVSFEGSLKYADSSHYIIRGSPGCGKTTYLHKLMSEMNDTITFHLCNMEIPKPAIDFLGDSIDFTNYRIGNSSVVKCVSVMFDAMHRILNRDATESFTKYRARIKLIVDAYNNYFRRGGYDIDAAFCYFRFLTDYLSKPATGKSYQELSSLLSAYMKDYLSRSITKGGMAETITFAANILIRLFVCLYKIDGKRQVCVIDNIEYFIPLDAEKRLIGDKDIKEIFDGIHNAISGTNHIMKDKSFYGFLLCVRNTTVRFFKMEQIADQTTPDIDITEWFSSKLILDSKRKYFQDLCAQAGNELLPDEAKIYDEVYANALGDISRDAENGLHNLMHLMYDHNHRENFVHATGAIARYSGEENDLVFFNEVWKDIKGKTGICSHVKYLCRKFILRILLDYPQNEHLYFTRIMTDHFKTDEAGKFPESISYARKIATLLCNTPEKDAINSGNDGFLSFPRLLHTILVGPYTENSPSERQIEDIAEIIYLMSMIDIDLTNWNALIEIKFEDKIYTKNNLIRTLKAAWEKCKEDPDDPDFDNTNTFGVKITDSGRFFAKIVCDFEYYACRSVSGRPALFARSNLARNKKSGQYVCIEIINTVKALAFTCVDQIMDREAAFFKTDENNDGRPGNPYCKLYRQEEGNYYNRLLYKKTAHPLRMLRSHYAYLTNYLVYIEQYLKEDDFDCPEDRERIACAVKAVMKEYYDKGAEITGKNPGYFNFEPWHV
jgi:hypothetical protein